MTLQEIAEELEVSYSHLSKCFKEVTDSSFNDYLLQVRMQEADVLLSSTSLGIAEVVTILPCRRASKMSFLGAQFRCFLAWQKYAGFLPKITVICCNTRA
ncbi:helix-turn-helix domain-containing protein [Sphaerochaeta sp.]|uniref:helix-turn-helix domain-containing protein n=1 Tax=Sphaerochaeta sp. TaxID=1972642 RepID=UPI0039B8D86F